MRKCLIFHPNDQVEIEEHIYKEVFVNFLAMISLKKKLMEHYVDLILISLKNTKIGWNTS